MKIAINFIDLILLVSLGLVFLLGQGWLVIGPLLHGNLLGKNKDKLIFQEIPLMLIGGLIINYGIVLIFQSLRISLIVSGILAVPGIVCFLIYIFRSAALQALSLGSINKAIGVVFICLVFLGPILVLPLTDWDAWSLWFFHAKMVYFTGSFTQLDGWQDPVVAFSHPDYPNLVPVLAAQIASLMGYWNEYLPKLSLFFILAPAITWLFTFARRSFSFAVLLLLIPLSFYALVWNGYMDGYLALYFALALLLIGRYFKTSQPVDLLSSVCCLVVLLYLKNEGILAAIVGICVILLVIFLKKTTSPQLLKRYLFLRNWKYLLALIVVILPFGLWGIYKQQWGLSNDLALGSAQSFLQMISRLGDGSYKSILKDAFKQIEVALALVGLPYFASVAWKKPLPREALPAVIAAGIYFLGMLVVYLMTPLDLIWQLNTSVYRTMLPVAGCLFVAGYFILNGLEN